MKNIEQQERTSLSGGVANHAAPLGFVMASGSLPIETKPPQTWPGDDPLESI